jgi:hypothetical protein
MFLAKKSRSSRLLAAVVAAAALAVAPAHASTVRLGYQGQPQTEFTDANASISIDGDARALTVTASGAGGDLVLKLAAPAGRRFERGLYRFAEKADFRTGLAPGVDAVFNGVECAEVWGAFTISQIGYDASGKVKLLEATFSQGCAPGATLLVGVVKYKVLPQYYLVGAVPGDPPGTGHALVGYTSDMYLQGGRSGVVFRIEGERQTWMIEIEPPAGKLLKPGTYPTTDYSHNLAVYSLRTHGEVGYCPDSAGTLNIVDVAFDAVGAVTGMNANFVLTCEGWVATKGTIRYNR